MLLHIFVVCESLPACVFRCDQVRNWCSVVAGRHHNVDSDIPSEPSIMGSHGRLYVLYHTQRNPIRTTAIPSFCTMYHVHFICVKCWVQIEHVKTCMWWTLTVRKPRVRNMLFVITRNNLVNLVLFWWIR